MSNEATRAQCPHAQQQHDEAMNHHEAAPTPLPSNLFFVWAGPANGLRFSRGCRASASAHRAARRPTAASAG
jgi:hypothetical protein